MPADKLLFLPGMMCDSRLWTNQVGVIDLPAAYADTSAADNFPAMAQQALANAPEQFALIGLSMGGILAFEIWRQAPERVTHMALLDTNPHAEGADRKSLRLQQIELAVAGGLRELAIESMKPMYLAAAHRDREDLLELILEMAMDLGPEVFRRQSLALRDRVDSVPTLATIDCPVSVICGDEDLLCPVDYHKTLAEQIPNARLRVIENCGHLSVLEQPDAVNRELEQLLAQ